MAEKDETAVLSASGQPEADLKPEPAIPREDLISKAVDFLQHEKVRTSALAQKRKFLLKKGLTADEVEIAVQRSGITEDVTASPHQMAVPAQNQMAPNSGHQMMMLPAQASVTPLAKIRDILSTLIMAGGIGYAVFKMVEKYFLPADFFQSSKAAQQSKIEKDVLELQTSLEQVISNLKESQDKLNQQSENIKQIVINTSQSRGSDALHNIQEVEGFNEIKQEISSLKGLLLSRKQFPPTPKTQPVIPSWQLASTADAGSTPAAVTDGDTSATETQNTAAEAITSASSSLGEEGNNSSKQVKLSEENGDDISQIQTQMPAKKSSSYVMVENAEVNGHVNSEIKDPEESDRDNAQDNIQNKTQENSVESEGIIMYSK